jgi:hypothetical protein
MQDNTDIPCAERAVRKCPWKYRKGERQLGGNEGVDGLHVTDAHRDRMRPSPSVLAISVFERFHQIPDHRRIARVAGRSLSCFIPRPLLVPAICAVFISDD